MTLNIDWQSNYLLNYIEGEEGVSTQYAGHFASLVNTGSYTRFKSLLATTFRGRPWTLGWRVHYIGAATVLSQDASVTPFASAVPIWYHDLVASFHRRRATYTVGADNVTNRRPPLLRDGQSNTNLNTYDIDGTLVYFLLSAAI